MVAGLVSACLIYFFRSVARRIINTFNPIKSFIVICFARYVFILRETLPSSLIIKSIIILSYSNSGTGVNYICLYLVYRTTLFY